MLPADADPAVACADIRFRTYVADGLPVDSLVCNLASTEWIDPLTSTPVTIYSNGDTPGEPSASMRVPLSSSTKYSVPASNA